MKKLKIAVGVRGNCVLLERFPDDEEHYGLQDMLEEFETNCTFDDPPGVYLAEFDLVGNNPIDPTDYDVYLDVITLEKL